MTARYEARGVTVRFGGVVALTDVSLAIDPGAMCGLIGSNGAGKSTLFDVLSGFTKPLTGAVHLDGSDVTTTSPTWRARRGVRRTFQRQQVFGNLTVRDNVLAALDWDVALTRRLGEVINPWARSGQDERGRRVAEVLALCGLEQVADVPAAHLSIGDIRMVELARAIVATPRILLLDEPTSGLDETEKSRLADVVHALRRDADCSVVLVEHDIPFVMDNCERVTVLHLGAAIAEGTPDEVSRDPAVRAAYLN